MRLFALMIVVILALAGGGCAGSAEESKNLNRQNKHAGKFVKENSADPEIKQAGADIEANAAVIEKVEGPPKEDNPYSKEQSEKFRAEGEAAAKRGFLAAAGATLLTIGAIAWALLKQTALKTALVAVETLVVGGQKMKAEAAAGTLTPDTVTETYRAAVALAPPKAKAKIEETLVRVKSKLPVELVTPAPTSTT
jgi:hypothetical protein